MSETATVTMIFALAVFLTSLLVAVSWFFAQQLRAVKKNESSFRETQQSLDERMERLETKIEFLNTGSIGFGQRLMSAEKRLNQLGEQQDNLAHGAATQASTEQLYLRQAERLLKGRGVPEPEKSPPSRSEARLMALVNTRQPETLSQISGFTPSQAAGKDLPDLDQATAPTKTTKPKARKTRARKTTAKTTTKAKAGAANTSGTKTATGTRRRKPKSESNSAPAASENPNPAADVTDTATAATASSQKAVD